VCQTWLVANQINPPRGMRDFLPAEKRVRDLLLEKIGASYRSRGFQSIETPALEDLDRLTSGQGGDNEKLVFQVLKRGEDLEQALSSSADLADLGLRFDLTVPLTRFYATNRAKLPRVFKALQVGPVWRAERPQRGRFRQFMQCDIDIIGEAGEAAEVELLLASLAALAELGLESATIRVNHRALLGELLGGFGVAESGFQPALIAIDKLDKIGADGVTKELEDRFGAEVAAQAENWLKSAPSAKLPPQLQSLFDAVNEFYPGKLRFDPTLVRGMGYYTGTIFEIEHPEAAGSIGGGGRYDGMVGRWLGTDVPAVGISLGFERVAELVAKNASESALVLLYEPAELRGALRLQQQAVASGWMVRLEPRPKNPRGTLDALADQGFTHFAIAAGSEFAALEVKPLAQS
jgi:histidyl-tRNA synthetase